MPIHTTNERTHICMQVHEMERRRLQKELSERHMPGTKCAYPLSPQP